MRMKSLFNTLILIIFLLSFPLEQYAQNSKIGWFSISPGFNRTVNSNIGLYSSFGQVLAGTSQSTSTSIKSGFLVNPKITPPFTAHSITLRSNWSIISSFIEPTNPLLDSIFKLVVSDIIIVKNGKGQTYIPSGGVNTIGNWIKTDGYQVKSFNASSLVINGTKIIPQTTIINLTTGWSLIAYLRDSEMDADVAFNTIKNDIIIVKDQDGRTYIPSAGINTIGNLKSGQGYQIKMLQTKVFTYPANNSLLKIKFSN